MDFNKYKKFQNKLIFLTNTYNKLHENKIDASTKLEELKELEDKVKTQIDEMINNCNHNYLLEYAKEDRIFFKIMRCSCLICGKNINYDEYRDYEEYQDKCLIDISDSIGYVVDLIFDNRAQKNIDKAREIFKKHLNKNYKNYSKEEIKKIISDDIISNFKNDKVKKKVKRNDNR